MFLSFNSSLSVNAYKFHISIKTFTPFQHSEYSGISGIVIELSTRRNFRICLVPAVFISERHVFFKHCLSCRFYILLAVSAIPGYDYVGQFGIIVAFGIVALQKAFSILLGQFAKSLLLYFRIA